MSKLTAYAALPRARASRHSQHFALAKTTQAAVELWPWQVARLGGARLDHLLVQISGVEDAVRPDRRRLPQQVL